MHDNFNNNYYLTKLYQGSSKDSISLWSRLQGIINFGTAQSGLMDDIWLLRFTNHQFFTANSSHFRYYQFWGEDDFRNNLAKFMSEFFKPQNPIDGSNVS